jgi:uncharacterized protein YkwD
MKPASTLLAFTLFAFAPAALAQNEMQSVLDAHNAYRARHCVAPLTWSPRIAATAQRWAERCALNHDTNSGLGENLAWGTQISGRDAVSLWYQEITQYNPRVPAFGPAGHFTQLVWRGSKQLGCGAAMCGGDVYWVCRYSPAGNFEGEYRANVSPVCR